jgi:hypothetical protein
MESGAGKQFDPVLVKRLRPLLASDLSQQAAKGVVTIASGDIKLIQQLWFALYPHWWDIRVSGLAPAEGFESWPKAAQPSHGLSEGTFISVAILDGKSALNDEIIERAGTADGVIWLSPPRREPDALRLPLDLESVLHRIQKIEAGVRGADNVTRILLADPYQLFRQALKHSLNEQRDMRVVCTVPSAAEFRVARKELAYDVAVVASDLLIGTLTTGRLKPGDVLLSQSEASAGEHGEPPTIILVSDEDLKDPIIAGRIWQPGESISSSAYIYRGSPVEVVAEAIRSLAQESAFAAGKNIGARHSKL